MTKDFETYVNMKDRIDLILRKRVDFLYDFFNTDGFCFHRDPPKIGGSRDEVDVISTSFCLLSILEDPLTKIMFIQRLTEKLKKETMKKHKDIMQTDPRKRIAEVLAGEKWDTEKKEENDIYTTPIAITALKTLEPKSPQPKVTEAAMWLINNLPDQGGVKYGNNPPNAFLTYWCVRALDLLSKPWADNVDQGLKDKSIDKLRQFSEWASNEINKQISYYSSGRHDEFDATQLAYSLAIHEHVYRAGLGIKLDPRILEKGIDLVFAFQHENGLWPKFTPIFHTMTQGSIYPFAYEMLDAFLYIVNEMNFSMFEKHLDKLSSAIRWVEENELLCECGNTEERIKAQGWRSNFLPVQNRTPQSWSTAAVFCAMARLRRLIGLLLNERILQEFRATRINVRNRQKFIDMKDCTVPIGNEKHSLKKIVRHFLIRPRIPPKPEKYKTDKETAVSAVFFGPTGTRKTGLAESIAYAIGWDFVKIQMGHFLAEGEQNVAARALYFFERLKHLEKAVVLFDEIEELVRTRVAKKKGKLPIPIFTRLMTASMLPLIQDLHGNKEIIFIIATNYMKDFDTAITRPGRIDLLLRIAPPNRDSKIDMMKEMWGDMRRRGQSPKITRKDIDYLVELIKNIYDTENIEYFLYSEWRDFLLLFFDRYKERAPHDKRSLEDAFVRRLRETFEGIVFSKAEELQDDFENSKGLSRIPRTADLTKLLTDSP